MRTMCDVCFTQTSVAVERVEGGVWGGGSVGGKALTGVSIQHCGLALGCSKHRRRTTDGAGGSERRNKKQLRPFLITLCVFALLQVTLVKSLERKSQRIQQSVLQPMKACFSKE